MTGFGGVKGELLLFKGRRGGGGGGFQIASILEVLRWRPKHPRLCTLQSSRGVFGYLGQGCLNGTMQKKMFGFWGGAPNSHTSVPRRPSKVFLDTGDGGVSTAQCQNTLLGFWGGGPNTHTSESYRPAKVFFDTCDGVFALHTVKKNRGVLRWRPEHPHLRTP